MHVLLAPQKQLAYVICQFFGLLHLFIHLLLHTPTRPSSINLRSKQWVETISLHSVRKFFGAAVADRLPRTCTPGLTGPCQK